MFERMKLGNVDNLDSARITSSSFASFIENFAGEEIYLAPFFKTSPSAKLFI